MLSTSSLATSTTANLPRLGPTGGAGSVGEGRTGTGLGVEVAIGATVGSTVAVAVAEAAGMTAVVSAGTGVKVAAIGASAVRVAAAARCTATSVATRSGADVASGPQPASSNKAEMRTTTCFTSPPPLYPGPYRQSPCAVESSPQTLQPCRLFHLI